MKKIVATVLLLFVIAISSFGVMANNNITVTVDGAEVIFGRQGPVIIEGRTLVPMRAIFEALGANVNWDDAAQTITATREDTVISMRIGSTAPTINGQTIYIDVPPAVIDGRTLVPLRFVIEALDIPMHWEAETRTVVINTDETEPEEENESEIDENQAIAILLFSAYHGVVNETFLLVLTSVVELVNFYLFVEEPTVIPENIQEYADAIRALLENNESGLYVFWNELGENGPVPAADGVGLGAGGQWPETEAMVAAALELRGIVEQVNS
jgi:hypothetical protein